MGFWEDIRYKKRVRSSFIWGQDTKGCVDGVVRIQLKYTLGLRFYYFIERTESGELSERSDQSNSVSSWFLQIVGN